MNQDFIPVPQDEALRLESSITKVANFAGTAKNMGSGFNPGGIGQKMAAVVNVTAIDRGNANETYVFTLKESSDGNTFTACGPSSSSLTATGAISVGGIVSKPYVKLDLVVGGTSPSITYEAWLNPLA